MVLKYGLVLDPENFEGCEVGAKTYAGNTYQLSTRQLLSTYQLTNCFRKKRLFSTFTSHTENENMTCRVQQRDCPSCQATSQSSGALAAHNYREAIQPICMCRAEAAEAVRWLGAKPSYTDAVAASVTIAKRGR